MSILNNLPKLKNFSIKWQLLTLSILLVSISIIAISIETLNRFRSAAYRDAEDNVKVIANDWYILTESFVEEQNRILKREEFLVEKRLESIVGDVRIFLASHHHDDQPTSAADHFDKSIFKRLEEIELGRSGFVFILDKDFNFIFSKNKQLNDKKFSDMIPEDGNRILQELKNLHGNQTYSTHYAWKEDPLKEPKKKITIFVRSEQDDLIIGAVIYHTDYKSEDVKDKLQNALKHKMAEQKIGDNGYLWAINSQGDYIVSKDMYRNGENISEAKDQNGKFFIQEIIQKARELPPGSIYLRYYPWRNVGENTSSKIVSATIYSPGWDWIIGVSADEKDFLKPLKAINDNIIRSSFFAVLIASAFAYIFASFIANPIAALELVCLKVQQGNLNAHISKEFLDRKDELGNLASSFLAMMNSLRNTIEQLKETQNKLVQSEKMASIGQLAAGVAHEINNPIGFISNNMEVLQEYVSNYAKILRVMEEVKIKIDGGDVLQAKATIKELRELEEEVNLDFMLSDVNKLLEQSVRGLERVRKIVLDLRTFAREDNIETKDIIKVEEIIDSILSIVQSELKYKAELIKDYGDTPIFHCNPQRLGQVFINLLVNAAQAIDEKGKIIIKTYTQDQHVCIDITDAGKGIPEENLKKIFDPFFTTKPVGQGTGLGLSVSYEIIKKHGGEIKVKSKIGEGTTFTVMLPVNNNVENQGKG